MAILDLKIFDSSLGGDNLYLSFQNNRQIYPKIEKINFYEFQGKGSCLYKFLGTLGL